MHFILLTMLLFVRLFCYKERMVSLFKKYCKFSIYAFVSNLAILTFFRGLMYGWWWRRRGGSPKCRINHRCRRLNSVKTLRYIYQNDVIDDPLIAPFCSVSVFGFESVFVWWVWLRFKVLILGRNVPSYGWAEFSNVIGEKYQPGEKHEFGWLVSQLTFTCSKSTIETFEIGVKCVQS